MAHDRKFVPGRVALVKIRFKNTALTADTQDIIERLIISSDFLKEAPFSWVGLMYKYGLKNDFKPKYSKIDKKYGELPISIELDSTILKWADDNNVQLFRAIFIISALDVLVDVGNKYNLTMNTIVEERKKYNDIPKTIEECESWG